VIDEVRRWLIGEAPSDPGDAVLATTLEEHRRAQETGAVVIPFHEALGAALPGAREVIVRVPSRRGYSFVHLLEWWVCSALAASSAKVTWLARRKEGAGGVERILAGRGWTIDRSREGAWMRMTGSPPAPGSRPEPGTFTDELGGSRITFAADWGVFSQEHVDPGTQMLFEAAAGETSDGPVVDVGCGYGPIAVGLTAAGKAPRALASEVDSVALWLTARNAASAGSDVALVFDDEPPDAEGALYVCNFPTHIEREPGERLLSALARRGRSSIVLIGCHASLGDRYRRRFETEGVACEVVAEDSHSVLTVSA
jgi:16S rRNA G1207 methylase RsmC